MKTTTKNEVETQELHEKSNESHGGVSHDATDKKKRSISSR
jgi:hypothetical protein